MGHGTNFPLKATNIQGFLPEFILTASKLSSHDVPHPAQALTSYGRLKGN